MPWATPSAADFKARFVRDFAYAEDTDQGNLDLILDSDINNAIAGASMHFNARLFGSDANATEAFMWLTAFFLVDALQKSAQGLGSKAAFPVSAQNAGPISITYQIPEKYMKDPFVSYLASNGYGIRYYFLARPGTIGNVRVVRGETSVG